MSTPINQELRELRMAKEHYSSVLVQDKFYKSLEKIDDDVKLLSDKDIEKINLKINAINSKIVELLKEAKDLKL